MYWCFVNDRVVISLGLLSLLGIAVASLLSLPNSVKFLSVSSREMAYMA